MTEFENGLQPIDNTSTSEIESAEQLAPRADETSFEWLRLDNAATIYPFARKRNWNNVYRLAYILKEEVDSELLKKALKTIAPRFPSLFVQLRAGVFWYYFDRARSLNIITKEKNYPCRPMSLFNSPKAAFRVIYNKNRIGVEVFHSVTDGNGGFAFLKALVAQYLSYTGKYIEPDEELESMRSFPLKEQLEDSFKANRISSKGTKRKEEKAYQYTPKFDETYFRVIHGLVPVDDLKQISKERNVTITDYLLALYIYAFYLDYRERFGDKSIKKPIKISVPVNLRPLFGSKTMRNFSLYTNVGFFPQDGQEYSFEDVFQTIAGKLKVGLEKDTLQKSFSLNVDTANNPFMRVVPLPLKRVALKIAYTACGESYFTSSMTNLGIIKLPAGMQENIDRIECLLGSSPTKHLSCAIVSFNGLLNISFTSNSQESGVQKHFFREMAKHGARVRIESNI